LCRAIASSSSEGFWKDSAAAAAAATAAAGVEKSLSEMFLNKKPEREKRERREREERERAHKVTTFTSRRLTTRVKNTESFSLAQHTLRRLKEKLSAEANKINVFLWPKS
jgi:hypothetical protein